MKKLVTLFTLLLGFQLLANDLVCRNYMPRPFSHILSDSMMSLDYFARKQHASIHYEDEDYGRKANVPYLDKKIGCQDVAQIGNTVIEINRFLQGHVIFPNSLALTVLPTDDNAFFMPGMLNLPMQFVLGQSAKHPIYTRPIWAHEYGHAIFDQNLASSFAAYGVNQRIKAEQLRCQLRMAPITKEMDRIDDLMYEQEDNLTEAQLAELDAQYERLETQADQMYAECEAIVEKMYEQHDEKLLEAAEYFDSYTRSYHELYADLIAVLHAGRGDIIAKSLSLNNNRTQDVTNRDFTYRGNSLRNWKPEGYIGVHGMMAPARYHIWRQYITLPEYRNRPGFIVRMVQNAMFNRLNIAYQAVMNDNEEMFDRIQSMTPHEINLDLMRQIDAEFAKHK